MTATNLLEIKLARRESIPNADLELLRGLKRNERVVDAHEDLITEGDNPSAVTLILEGFACRYKLLPDGQRSIMAYLLPGDICDLHVALLGEMDHSIATLSECRVSRIDKTTVSELEERPHLRRALWLSQLVDHAISRQWIINLARRRGDKMIAHLMCEILSRLQAVGLAADDSFAFPVTQGELGDTLGVSTVHVNRMLAQLRNKGLIAQQGRNVQVLNFQNLSHYCDFDARYLHLEAGQ